MIYVGEMTLTLTVRLNGLDVDLSHTYSTTQQGLDKDVRDMLTVGAEHLQAKWDNIQTGGIPKRED